MAQVATPIITSAPDLTSQAALFLTRLIRAAAVPPIRNARTADSRDIEATRAALDMATDIYVSHVGRLLLNLNENMPMDRVVDPDSFLSALGEIKDELDGELMQAADLWNEENGQFGVGA